MINKKDELIQLQAKEIRSLKRQRMLLLRIIANNEQIIKHLQEIFKNIEKIASFASVGDTGESIHGTYERTIKI